ncbi:hypothetical protein [Halorientalis halophila]|uniref:hypothetical protein n=1 Tax=Halorientalis halophila TaxID=3108499 RepID=UPI00300A117B
MRRRTLLATAGIALSAGCSESIPVLDPEETDTETAPENPEASPEAVPTETDGATTSAEPTETEDPQTDTPSRAEREGAQVIATAREQLGEAYTNFVAFAGAEDATLLDVTVATQVSFTQVTGPASRARETLDDLPRRASGEQIEAARGLRGVAHFLEQSVRCHVDLGEAYEEFETVVDQLYSERSGFVPNALGRMREAQTAATEHLDAIAAEATVEDATAFDPLDVETFDAKVAQLEQGVTAFERLPDLLGGTKRGFDAFRSAGSAYRNDQYLEARREFSTARDRLEPVTDGLSQVDAPDPMATAVTDLTDVTDALVLAAVDLETAADAGSRGDREDRDAALADAKVHLRASAVAVERLETVQRLLDE